MILALVELNLWLIYVVGVFWVTEHSQRWPLDVAPVVLIGMLALGVTLSRMVRRDLIEDNMLALPDRVVDGLRRRFVFDVFLAGLGAVIVTAVLPALIVPREFRSSAIVVTCVFGFTFGRSRLLEYRLRRGWYGTNRFEAAQLIAYILKDYSASSGGDGLGISVNLERAETEMALDGSEAAT